MIVKDGSWLIHIANNEPESSWVLSYEPRNRDSIHVRQVDWKGQGLGWGFEECIWWTFLNKAETEK